MHVSKFRVIMQIHEKSPKTKNYLTDFKADKEQIKLF